MQLISQHQDANFIELTGGQGGVDWHIVRSGSGCVTSTIAHALLVSCQATIAEENRFVLDDIGIRRTDADAVNALPANLISLTVVQLKGLCTERGLVVSGNKPDLVQRLQAYNPVPLTGDEEQLRLKKVLLSKWYMKPSGTTSAMKVGSANEDNISSALPNFLQSYSPSGVTYSVSAMSPYGLISNRRCKYMCTLPDQILVLDKQTNNLNG